MRRTGSVLILALWTLFFLSALAVAVGAHVSAGLTVARRLSAGTRAYYAARAGVEKAIAIVLSDSNGWDAASDAWCGDEDVFRDVSLEAGRFTVTSVPPGGGDDEACSLGLVDEARRVNVNEAEADLLRAFFESAAGLDSMEASRLASAIEDWRDSDDEELTGGAESGYYLSSGLSHGCHNGSFQSTHELLLVKGMTPSVFRRIEPYVTVYGEGKVNVNTADAVVLKSLAVAAGGDVGVCESLVRRILDFREAGEVFDEPTVGAMGRKLRGAVALRPEEDGLFRRMLSAATIRSTCFRGWVTGYAEDKGTGEARRRHGAAESRLQIAFVFDRERQMKVYWREF